MMKSTEAKDETTRAAKSAFEKIKDDIKRKASKGYDYTLYTPPSATTEKLVIGWLEADGYTVVNNRSESHIKIIW